MTKCGVHIENDQSGGSRAAGAPGRASSSQSVRPGNLSDVDWRAYFSARYATARARMEKRQSPPPPPKPVRYSRSVSDRKFLRGSLRACFVYARPIGPEMPKLSDRIIIEVCRSNQISFAALVGKDRNKSYVRARQECFWRLRTECGLSFPEIGRMIGMRDHTTVLHGVRQHQSLVDALGEAT